MDATQYRQFESPSTPGPGRSCVGVDIASASTIAPDHLVHIVSGTTQIDNITVPYEGFEGSLLLIPTGAWATGTGGNIANAVTATANKPILFVYHKGNNKWYAGAIS